MIINIYLYNLYKGSFLEEGFDKWMKEKGIDGFDIIVGNPPYNSDGGIGGGKGGRSGLWKDFIYKSLNILNKNGFLLNVVPNTWAGNKSDFKKFKKYNLLHLNINECSKHFKIDNTFSYFLLQKSPYSNKTIIQSKKSISNIDISNIEYLPLSSDIINDHLFIILEKIYSKGKFEFSNGTSHSINTDFISYDKNNEYKYPLFYSSDEKRKLVYSNIPFKGYGDIKLVTSYINDFDGDHVNHFTDINKDKGVGKQSGYFKMESYDECNKLRTFLKSNIVIFVNNIYRNGRYANPVLNNIPLIDLNIVDDNNKIFDYYGLDNNDREFINEIIKTIKKG